jgi:hypothetical protein
MSRSRARLTRGIHAVLLGALVMLVVAPAAEAAGKVTVDAKVAGTPGFNKMVRGTVAIRIEDGSKVRSVTWRQTLGAPARLTKLANNAVRVRLATEPVYRHQLIHVLSEAPLPLPAGTEYLSGLQNRWQVVGISPFALEEAGRVQLEVTVLTTSGSYKDTVDVELHLPFAAVSPGLNNVPVRVPVVLHGKEQASYAWKLEAPAASDTILRAANTRNPFFVPDVPGTYELTVNDLATGKPVKLTVYAGTWRGIIVGQDAAGMPVSDPACTNCHDRFAEDKFTPWAESGHASIFSDNLKTSTHYGSACLSCHGVGFDLAANNGGMDDASDFKAFQASTLMSKTGPDNWTRMLEQFPQAAKKANIQCENCHGPQVTVLDDTPAHGLNEDVVGNPRVSLSSDVCGTCHGEPMRHSRFQQWQLSGHGNQQLADLEGMSAGCAKCHTANGFLAWVAGGAVANQTPPVTWKAEDVHALTCVTCHDPHAVGNKSTTAAGVTDAPMRITGDTPVLMAGFKALSAGSGAICMTCHNARRGLRNDATFTVGDAARAPHLGTQTDVLMGQNAYLVRTGVRGRHSFVNDTCVQCHLRDSHAPTTIAMAGNGTNHTFVADKGICNDCHTGLNVDTLQHGFETMLDNLKVGIEARIKAVMAEQIALGNTIDIGGTIVTSAAAIKHIELTESHGQQAIDVDLVGGAHLSHITMGTVRVVRPAPQTPIALYAVSGSELPKAAWNYFLLHADGSKGAHNPTWSLEVIDESLRAVGVTNANARTLKRTDLIVGMR